MHCRGQNPAHKSYGQKTQNIIHQTSNSLLKHQQALSTKPIMNNTPVEYDIIYKVGNQNLNNNQYIT
jgi:hypothetical protein